MKALRIWGWILFAISLVLYGIGVFSGVFTRHVRFFPLLLYGTSTEAILLLACSIFSMILATTVLFVVRAINSQKE